MDKKLLKKFITNKCTSTEVDKVFRWVQKQSDQASGKILFKTFWDEIKATDKMDKNLALKRLDRIHHIINIRKSEQIATSIFRKKRFLIQLISKAAAILLIPVITLFIYTRFIQPERIDYQLNEIISPSGSRTFLELSDGTKVWLNHGSKMIYPQIFTGKIRTVKLSGEGYFEVAHDKTKPFIVETGNMAVKAVGTAFNVKAYQDDVDFETTLETGKVIVLKKAPNKNLTVCEMSPGQHLIFNSISNYYSIETGELAKYVSWKEGKLVFNDDHMDQVAQRLSRWYNVEIDIKDPDVKKLTYTATFIDESLDQILEMLEVVTPISFTIQERQKMPDGTYSKKKILIEKKKAKKQL
ncbi:MAG: FecR family protein [Mangrovibacterium sp.]